MDKLVVTGGTPLSGIVKPHGNKNSVLPLLCASILTDDKVTITNVPDIIDVEKLVGLFQQLNSDITWLKEQQTINVQNTNMSLHAFDGQLPGGMRASILLLAPLLIRFGEVTINTQIGGCELGVREIDPHIKWIERLGATVKRNGPKVTLTLKNGTLETNHVWPEYASVTTTENLLMFAAATDSRLKITNAASEPHVQDLCNLLEKMGAHIDGTGKNVLEIHGSTGLNGAAYSVSPDYHEIATLLALTAMTNGKIEVLNTHPQHTELIFEMFSRLGVEITTEPDLYAIVTPNQSFKPEIPFTQTMIPRIQAAPWPYFPADLLPLMIALAVKTEGPVEFWNKVYEGGLDWVEKLRNYGVRLTKSDSTHVIIHDSHELYHPQQETILPDIIRASIAILMVALTIEGQSVLTHTAPMRRAHPNFIQTLKRIGANIEEL